MGSAVVAARPERELLLSAACGAILRSWQEIPSQPWKVISYFQTACSSVSFPARLTPQISPEMEFLRAARPSALAHLTRSSNPDWVPLLSPHKSKPLLLIIVVSQSGLFTSLMWVTMLIPFPYPRWRLIVFICVQGDESYCAVSAGGAL